MKTHVKAGDEVVVITGVEKGKRSRVLQVFPKRGRVLLEGINLVKRHQKSQSQDGQKGAEGGIVEREAPLHISNVMRVDRFDRKSSGKVEGKAEEAVSE